MSTVAHHPGPQTTIAGALLFSRFAFPPDERCYGSPDRAADLVEHVSQHRGALQAEELAGLLGPSWPYLAHLAACMGASPLDPKVVEAYWLGEPVVDRCGGPRLAGALADRFEPRMTEMDLARLRVASARGGAPHHNFHVFAVSPWATMLREGSPDTALQMLDRCRIRWGQVTHVEGDRAVIESQRLVWDGHWLALSEPGLEVARFRHRGHVLEQTLDPGDWVAMHWDWVADRIGPTRLTWLRNSTAREIEAVNTGSYPARSSAAA